MKRKLATNGNKAELISRLEAADSETVLTTLSPATDAKAHLPSAEEYEINWDEDDTAASGPKSAKLPPAKPESPELKKVVVASASAGDSATMEEPKILGASSEKKPEDKNAVAVGSSSTTEGKKPFTFKRLADQFSDLPSNRKPDAKKAAGSPKSPAPAEKKDTKLASKPDTQEKLVTTPTPAAPEPSFTANLPPTPLEAELEKRKARAARFGADNTDPAATESLKKLERAARFGAAEPAEDSVVGVKGLDQALPEHMRRKRGNEHTGGGGRGGVQKRARFGHQGQRRQGGGAGGGNDRRNGGGNQHQQKKAGGGSGAKSVLDDPTEREKAERRKNRFGNPA